MAKSKGNDESDRPSFEGAMSDLELIVRKLESGTMPLEQMLTDYAKAVELVQHCHSQLDSARRRIAQLESVRPDGKPVVREWDDEAPQVADSTEAPSRKRSR